MLGTSRSGKILRQPLEARRLEVRTTSEDMGWKALEHRYSLRRQISIKRGTVALEGDAKLQRVIA